MWEMTSRICFFKQRCAWSDGGFTLKRQSTEAVGTIPHIFQVKVRSNLAVSVLVVPQTSSTTEFGEFV